MSVVEQKKEQCCGCTACSSICPRNAITILPDEQGFFYPHIDREKCVNCGLCDKVCPMQTELKGQSADPKTYAARLKDPEVRKESSSGGVFTSLIRWSTESGGTVYGAAFDREFRVCHMRAESEEAAAGFRTSKYVDSDLAEILTQLEKDLKDGRPVVMSGRPCQICAAKNYLSLKNVNTDKLLTCDIVCHGVPSRKIWEDYLSIIRQKYMAQDDSIEFVSMRSKRRSWKKQVLEIRTKNGLDQKILDEFSYNRFYLSLFGHRPSCFRCPFTSYARTSDITLGDFWNVESAGVDFDIEQGINAVLVSTPKGEEFFDQFAIPNLDCQPVPKQAVWQPYLEYSANAPKKYTDFWKEYTAADSLTDKEKILRRYMEGSFLTRVIHLASPVLQKTGLYKTAGKLYKIVFARDRR